MSLKRGREAIPLAEADAVAAELARRLVFGCRARFAQFPASRKPGETEPEVVPVGSLRRREPRVRDLDLLVVVPRAWEAHLSEILPGARLAPPRPGDVIALGAAGASGPRHRALVCKTAPGPGQGPGPREYAVDLFLATRRERAFALFHLTGPRAYNIRTRAAARRHGWLLNQYGLFIAPKRGAGARRERAPGSERIRSERALARLLGVSYRAPEERGPATGPRGRSRGSGGSRRRTPRPRRGR